MISKCTSCQRKKTPSERMYDEYCVHCMKAQATEGKYPFYKKAKDEKHEN